MLEETLQPHRASLEEALLVLKWLRKTCNANDLVWSCVVPESSLCGSVGDQRFLRGAREVALVTLADPSEFVSELEALQPQQH